tara:strand:+ start:874 stop:1014 length:141 start_codon:yes stop_codon:yes gene_type:complete
MKNKIDFNSINRIMNGEKKYSDMKKKMVREKFFNRLSDKIINGLIG